MTPIEIILYLGGALISGYCLGFGLYSWRKFFEIL